MCGWKGTLGRQKPRAQVQTRPPTGQQGLHTCTGLHVPGTRDAAPQRRASAWCAGLGQWLMAVLALRELAVQSSGQRLPLLGRWGLRCGHSYPRRAPLCPYRHRWAFLFLALRGSKTDSGPGALRGTSGKEPACRCRRRKTQGFDPWVGKIPRRRAWQPTPVFLPGESQTEEPGGPQSMGSQRHD